MRIASLTARCALLIVFALLPVGCSMATAGPPYVTDDPEPTDYHSFEIYLASIYEHAPGARIGTLPHLEVDYGGFHNIQLAMFLPISFAEGPGPPFQYGLGDTEFGVKWKVQQETKRIPMIAIYPQVLTPTGNESRGLGTGTTQLFLPIWLQKSRGPWTAYGGGGYWFSPGPVDRNYVFAGWLIQRDINKRLTMGTEVFYTQSTGLGVPDRFSFNVGGQFSIDEGHHIVFSFGRDISGNVDFMSYVGYEWTFGPRSTGEPAGHEPPALKMMTRPGQLPEPL